MGHLFTFTSMGDASAMFLMFPKVTAWGSFCKKNILREKVDLWFDLRLGLDPNFLSMEGGQHDAH